jgi:uncharacterized protein YecT (DUF1311 family)
MATDDFPTDLSKLEQDYQILTELHRSRDSRTYLARHLQLNRDVTITVIRRGTGDTRSLSRFAGDVERLKTARHPNVIPVIEGRWLPDGSFAVVRARVRGSSLDQLVSAIGAVPLVRVASALQQVKSALDWARNNAIANRAVDPDSMIFQQGSGRVLLSLEPSLAASMPDSCEDARVIGRLGWEMLAGEAFDAASVKSLAGLRPDLSSTLVAETEALMRCEPGSAADVGAYIAMLGGSAALNTPVAFPAAMLAAQPVVAAPVTTAVRVSQPVGQTGDAVVVRRQGWGFGARFATGVAVLAAIAVLAFLFLNHGTRKLVDRTATNEQGESTGQAAGDVSMNAQHPDTTPAASSSAYPATTVPAPVPSSSSYSAPYPTTAPTSTPTPAPSASVAPAPAPAPVEPPVSTIVPPETRRHEPLRTTQPTLAFPSVTDSTQPTRPDSTVTMAVTDVCSSPAESDQHKCLMNAIDRNDIPLNAVYEQLTAALRRQANVSADDPDPASIEKLRSSERQWMDQRDQTCHTAGNGPLYAHERAQCFADESAKRTHELQEMLDSIPND